MPDRERELPSLPTRSQDGHKGDYGHVLVVAGSRGMGGAAGLCGLAALRAGAGRVTVACPESAAATVAAVSPCLMTLPLPDDGWRFTSGALAELLPIAASADVIAIGPGLGRSEGVSEVVHQLLDAMAVPIVLDADGLNALDHPNVVLSGNAGPRVLTPHPGEFARLLGLSIEKVQARREDLSCEFAARFGVVVLLKGRGTIITDGLETFCNGTGNPGMATAGAGDVLTGIIAAFIGQGLTPFDAARLGAHLHGAAGDLAAEGFGGVSLIASDLLDYLPLAIQKFHTEVPSCA